MRYRGLFLIAGLLLCLSLLVACTSENNQSDEPTPTEEKQEEGYQRVTADDILSLSPGDRIEIKCYTGSIQEGQHSDTEQMFHVYLHAKDSNDEEWDVDGMNVAGSTDEIMNQLTDIMNETTDYGDHPGYDIVIRGKVYYAGEGAEGSGHPHGIYFGWNDSEIVKVSDNQND